MAKLFEVNSPIRKPLFEGVQGENEARSIQFDITPWVTELGDGAVTATAKRSQDSQPYPVTVTKDGTTVTWKPTSTDTAFAGVGSFQLEYTVDSVLAKTCIWSTMVAPSLDPAGDPPDPYDNWLAEMREIEASAIQAAQDADESADDAQAEVYEAEAWAKGTKNGTPVSSTDAQYQNNAKYYAEESYKNSEAWAVGQRGGVDVPSTDPTYHNSSKYWAEQSLANQYGAYIVKSASGNIASFADGADNVPMKSLKVQIVPKQAGSGDPSPSNVRPIAGTSTANVTVTGTNVWDEETELGGLIWANGQPSPANDRLRSKNFALCAPNTKYHVFNARAGSVSIAVFFYDASQAFINYTSNTDFTTPSNAHYFKLVIQNTTTSNHDISVNYPFTDTEYHAYNGHTTPVPLGQTVYGGEVDVVSGVLTISMGIITDMSTLPWTAFQGGGHQLFNSTNIGDRRVGAVGYCEISTNSGAIDTWGDIQDNHFTGNPGNYRNFIFRADQYSTAADFKNAVAGKKLVYELETPTTVQLTPTQVASLLGTNNVWADCGSVEVEYRADPTLAYNELANVIVSLGGNL